MKAPPNEYYRLRAYHNPRNVDESKAPAGWRFRYADEMNRTAKDPCVIWFPWRNRFSKTGYWAGRMLSHTYIVPVTA